MTSRDTEIERIAEAVEKAMLGGYVAELPTAMIASRLYDAGLRSQPASEPSLDVAWKAAEAALIAAQGDDDGFGMEIAYWDEFPDEPWYVSANGQHVAAARLPDALAKLADFLSQPADNEAAT